MRFCYIFHSKYAFLIKILSGVYFIDKIGNKTHMLYTRFSVRLDKPWGCGV